MRVLALLLCLALPGLAQAQKVKDGFAFGSAAVSHIGGNLAGVAKANNFKSGADLKALLLKDKDLGIDKKSSRLAYACSGLVAVAPNATAAAAAAAGRHLLDDQHGHYHHHDHDHHDHGLGRKLLDLPLAGSARALLQLVQANLADPTSYPTNATTGLPLLHSRPAATRKIFLDFDGHTITGTAWNTQFENGQPIITPPFDKDGNNGSFNAGERSDIVAIWRAIAEDYAAFDVDVTPEDPGVDGLVRSTTTNDVNYGTRVAIGGSCNDWFGSLAGGVAYLNSMGNATYQPAFVFQAQLGSTKAVWEATSHEVGHTVGLNHDGQDATATSSSVGYYEGHGDWAPIMGVGYYKPITQFSRGEYINANNKQDDYATMSGYMPYASDDHGNTIATATALAPGAVTSGIIGFGTADPADVFKISAAAGSLSVQVDVPTAWSNNNRANLDDLLTLMDAAGAVLATANPVGTGSPLAQLSAPLTYTLAAPGTYYLSVSKTGYGNPLNTGYSDYGSVGQYAITASYTAIDAPPGPPPGPSASPGPSPSPPPAPSPPLNVIAPTVSLALGGSCTKPTLIVTLTDKSTNEANFPLQRCSGSTTCTSFAQIFSFTSTSTATTGVAYRVTDNTITKGTWCYRAQACTSTGACSAFSAPACRTV